MASLGVISFQWEKIASACVKGAHDKTGENWQSALCLFMYFLKSRGSAMMMKHRNEFINFECSSMVCYFVNGELKKIDVVINWNQRLTRK